MNVVSASKKRLSDLRLIHIAKKQLHLEDDEYRAILQDVTGSQSAGDLNVEQRQALLDRFKKIGFKVQSKGAGRVKPKGGKDRALLISKIEAQLAEAKRPWSYTDSMAKRMFKIDRIDFCEPEHLEKIIAALSYDAKRHGRKEA
jgi:phage gp16-like protein